MKTLCLIKINRDCSRPPLRPSALPGAMANLEYERTQVAAIRLSLVAADNTAVSRAPFRRLCRSTISRAPGACALRSGRPQTRPCWQSNVFIQTPRTPQDQPSHPQACSVSAPATRGPCRRSRGDSR